MTSTPQIPNGVATPAPATAELTSLPPIVGINFGNSYASIAVFAKEGLAECIANEDGERQIACAISFRGEEMYIGNEAKHQLVKNAQNTITGFRNLLGKKFSEIPQSELTLSAPVIQHPDLPDTPAYKVTVLQPSPTPLPHPLPRHLLSASERNTSTYNTPAASNLPTPRSEPIQVDRYLTIHEVTTLFLKSLLASAEAFLGKKVKDAVITVPAWFTPPQREALEKAALDTGVNVLQLLDEVAAVVATTTSDSWAEEGGASDNNSSGGGLVPDRTQLVVDVGASSTTISLLSLREGLAYVLASSSTLGETTGGGGGGGGDQIDSKLIAHFAAEFTKKTKIPLTFSSSSSSSSSADPQDKRAEAKLRLALEHTKRTISASPGAATCSVESLKDGIDFTASINRMRFDLVARPVYVSISNAIASLLGSSQIDPHEVDEIVYVGGSASLPGLDEHILLSCGFRSDEDSEGNGVETPFSRGTVVGGGVGDPTTILARGCAVQAFLVSEILAAAAAEGEEEEEEDQEIRNAFGNDSKAGDVPATTRTLGVLLPSSSSRADELGGTWIPIVQKETALPARRIVRFDVELPGGGSNKVALEVWEVKEGIRVEKVKPPKPEYSDNDSDADNDEEEEIEVKHKTITKETLLGVVQFEAKLGVATKGKSGKTTTTTLDVQFIVGIDADLDVSVREFGGKDGAVAGLQVPGSSA